MHRFAYLVVVASLFASSLAFADMGDMDMSVSDMDMSVSDMGANDMDMSIGDMADMSDMAPSDMATDMVADLGDMAPDADMADMNNGPFVFEGVIELRDQPDWSGSLIALTSDTDAFAATTGANGLFRFEAVPAGTYQLEVSQTGYTSVSEELVISRELTRRFVLYPEGSATVTLQIELAEAPAEGDGDTVEISLTSERGQVTESLPLAGGTVVEWSGELETGSWTADVELDGFLPASYAITVEDEDIDVNMTLFKFQTGDVTTREECACRTINADAGVPFVGLLLLIGGMFVRRRRA